MEVVFDKAGCKSFFKKYHRQQTKLQTTISQTVIAQVEQGMNKVKLATHDRINGQLCYEFRLNLGTLGSARLAFYVAGTTVTVLFISTDLQKSTFTTELNQVLKGRV